MSRSKTSLLPFVAALLALALATLAMPADEAEAGSPIVDFSTTASTTQAGGHPDITISSKTGTSVSQLPVDPCRCRDPKDLIVNLPAGVIGNPHATPRCEVAEFAIGDCPSDSQIGMVAVLPCCEIGGGLYTFYVIFPLYNLVPRPDEAGLSGFLFEGRVPIYTQISARTGGDYGLRLVTPDLPHFLPPYGIFTYLWGVPADPSHDPLRIPRGEGGTLSCPSPIDPRQELSENKLTCAGFHGGLTPLASNSPQVPLLSNPATCTGPLTSTITVLSYDKEVSHSEATYPGLTGCQQSTFNPSLSATPSTTQADSPAGLDIDLSVPQVLSPTVPSPTQIKATTVAFPQGFSINPNAADGKTTCSDVAARFGTEDAAQCPEFSKVGTLTIDSSALPDQIPGYIYLGDPKPGDRYRIILVADGFGTHIKLSGSAILDPLTGQLTTSFQDLPQSPLTRFTMHFFGSERGLLATPTSCGTYPVRSTFTPWTNELPVQTATQFFVVDSGPGGTACPESTRPFSPKFQAFGSGNTAGAYAPFAVELTRNDGEQGLASLTVTTPPGFSASLKGVAYCPESVLDSISKPGYPGLDELASPSCPTDSQVGTTIAGAGAGSRPLYTQGKVYLAGPYKGAPVSLAVVVPAVSGPYDLGTVVVRAAVHIDPVTAQVRTISDPLPRILAGIPLRTRSIRVALDRKDFTLNPTNCDPFSVDATISGEEGATVGSSSLFQVANCARLPYAPGLSLRLSGGVNRRGHPAVRAELTSSPGEANSRRISVTLPKGELLDNDHIGTVCTRVDFAKDSCPRGSLLGNVEVTTPLLDRPLTGSIFLRSSKHELPDLALDLEGQFDIEAAGRIDSIKGQLRTTFETTPDVPISRIVFKLTGGSKGLLENTKSLCGGVRKADVRMVGHNNVRSNTKVKLKVACAASPRRKRNGHVGRAVR